MVIRVNEEMDSALKENESDVVEFLYIAVNPILFDRLKCHFSVQLHHVNQSGFIILKKQEFPHKCQQN